ncbi:helix-turn-helix transcriptional regulator [Blastococcus sp. CT_GayMR16]|uniref:helix-turn-helix transcriptional regulator n=1 Tax=Blastococcus sp. CT_GayMR16 TaxID=2559607 RepID=UPI001431A510|nr:helix-turn-helix transcriptional regulator [Blastococcus sp. CT_GayMR16]
MGELLRDRRERAALTQREVADRAGLSLRAINSLECGRVARPRIHTLRVIAAAIGLKGDAARLFVFEARSIFSPAASHHGFQVEGGGGDDVQLLSGVRLVSSG